MGGRWGHCQMRSNGVGWRAIEGGGRRIPYNLAGRVSVDTSRRGV